MSHQHMPSLNEVQGNRKEASKLPLSPKQATFLNNFRVLVERNGGTSPSLEELAEASGIKKATARDFVNRLRSKGYLVKRGGTYRSLRLA
jgi:DNA-binding MarR family transcriptional regulator